MRITSVDLSIGANKPDVQARDTRPHFPRLRVGLVEDLMRILGYSFFPSTTFRNASHKIGAVSGPRLLISPYCAVFRP
jgi:hypothetical protein